MGLIGNIPITFLPIVLHCVQPLTSLIESYINESISMTVGVISDWVVHRHTWMVLEYVDQLRVVGGPRWLLVVHRLQLLLKQPSLYKQWIYFHCQYLVNRRELAVKVCTAQQMFSAFYGKYVLHLRVLQYFTENDSDLGFDINPIRWRKVVARCARPFLSCYFHVSEIVSLLF